MIITYLLIFSRIKLIGYRRFCIGNLEKNLFPFSFLQDAEASDSSEDIGDFALGTLKNIIFFFSL